ncbi:transposase family protein [Streptomyces sp. NPDC057651]|uniref:transposase family protein n=1 Tax=unclassified Streptomyces TaxID=2593676 RepID=UPI0036C7887F
MVLLDGTPIRTRRRTGAANRRNYSGKHKAHGLLLLALTDEKGRLVWISAARPGRSSEITTARHNKLIEHLRVAGLSALDDLSFISLDDDPDNPVLITGYKAARTKPLTSAKNEANKLIARERACLRARLPPPEKLANSHKLRLDTRHAAAGAARTHEPRSRPLTDDSPSTPAHDQREYPITHPFQPPDQQLQD